MTSFLVLLLSRADLTVAFEYNEEKPWSFPLSENLADRSAHQICN